MTNLWIPGWVAAVWAGLFVLVVLVHAGHIVMMSGRHRYWHTAHVVMAAGMVVMFWPTDRGMPVPPGAGITVYASAALLLLAGLGAARLRGRPRGPLWWVTVADLAAMAYMFAMMSSRLAWLSVLAAVWFAAQACGWASGWLGVRLEHGDLGDRVPPTHPSPNELATTSLAWPSSTTGHGNSDDGASPAAVRDSDVEAASRSREPVESGTATAVGPGGGSTMLAARAVQMVTSARRRVIDGGRGDLSVRITLTVMGFGMGYMLLAMQFGTPVTPSMGGMSGM